MRLSKISETASELHLPANGADLALVILFSYDVPVAARLPSGRIVMTSDILTAVPTRHVEQFIQRTAHQPPVLTVKQSVFDMMLRNATT